MTSGTGTPTQPELMHWWDEMALIAEEQGHDRWSAGWYASMRDQHAARFPDADERSKANMRELAEWAAADDARIIGASMARAVGRFEPDGPTGYRAATAPGAPIRSTRAEAVADEWAFLDARGVWVGAAEQETR